MNAKELSIFMADHASTIVEHLLPQGKKAGKEWKVGGVNGEAGGSMSVCLSGVKRGVWKDFATGDSGDLLSLWAQCRAMSIAEAMRAAKQFLGIRDDVPLRPEPKTYKRPKRVEKKQCGEFVSEWLSGRGLTDATIAAFQVAEYVSRDDKTFAQLPFIRDGETINSKYRNLSEKRDMRQEPGAEPCLFGWHLIKPTARIVAIAEGEIDAMTLHQMGIPALSGNAGAGNHQWIDNDFERLERFSEILLCYDNDEAGVKGAREVANRLGLERCRVVIFDGVKDANEYLLNGATTEDFQRCIAAGRAFDPEELRSMADFWGELKELFHPTADTPENPVLSFGGRKEFWFEFRTGEVTVWTGYNGHGKSLMLSQVMIGLMDQGERACVFSGEMTPKRQCERMAKQLGGNERPAPAYLDHMQRWVRDRIWLFNLSDKASIDRLIEVFSYGFKRYGIRHFVIDSLMMTDVQMDGPGSMSSQKDAMRKLANFARSHDVHLHLVAHPRKGQNEDRIPGKQDVSGAGVLTDAADNVFAVWSAQKEQEDPEDTEPDAFLQLQKQRNGEEQHRSLALFINRKAQQFTTNRRRLPHIYVPFNQNAPELIA